MDEVLDGGVAVVGEAVNDFVLVAGGVLGLCDGGELVRHAEGVEGAVEALHWLGIVGLRRVGVEEVAG